MPDIRMGAGGGAAAHRYDSGAPEAANPPNRMDDGFTLIELLVVLALISILASIAALSVAKFRKSAIEKACQSDAKSVEVAARSYQAVNDNPPPAQPAADGTFPADPNQRIVPKFIQNWPTSSSYKIFWTGPPPVPPPRIANDAYGQDSANPAGPPLC